MEEEEEVEFTANSASSGGIYLYNDTLGWLMGGTTGRPCMAVDCSDEIHSTLLGLYA